MFLLACGKVVTIVVRYCTRAHTLIKVIDPPYTMDYPISNDLRSRGQPTKELILVFFLHIF
jgi:hypothetical protein